MAVSLSKAKLTVTDIPNIYDKSKLLDTKSKFLKTPNFVFLLKS